MRSILAGVSVIALSSVFGTAALAQTTTAASAQTEPDPASAKQSTASVLDEIVVTATKRSEAVNTVPMSITAATGQALQSLGVTDVGSLTKIVPGFNAVDSSYGSPVYYLRGVGYFETTMVAKPTVGVYVDEIPLAFSNMTAGAAFDLERVEVLKGPQGTLFGSNATGGAINYIAAKPTDTFKAGLSGSAGNFGALETTGFLSGPLTDTLSARLAVRREVRDDWQRSTTRDDSLGARNFTQGRLALQWRPNDALQATLTLSGFIDRSDTQAPQFVEPFKQTVSSVLNPRLVTYPAAIDNARQADWGATFPWSRDNTLFQGSLRLDYNLSETLTLTSLTSYSKYRQDQTQDGDGTDLIISDLRITGNVESYFQELRLQGDFTRGSWILGANYEHSGGPELVEQRLLNSSSAGAFAGLGVAPFDIIPQITDTTYESYGIFANVDYDLTEQLKLHAGARYTDTTTDFTGCVINGGNGSRGLGFSRLLGIPNIPIGQCSTIVVRNGVTQFGQASGNISEDNISWRVGLDYTPRERMLIYANISRGYKAGGYSNLPGSSEDQYRPVKQEELTAYEIGFKTSLAQRTLQLNGAVFYYDYADKQVKGRTNVPIFNFLEALVNVPESSIKGAEIQIDWLPVTGLRFGLGAAYLDTEITGTFNNFSAFGQPIDFKGYGFANTPKWQANASVEYRWPVSDTLGAYVGANANYRSDTNGDFKPDPRLAIDGYTLIDLRAGIESDGGNWRLGVYGRNVTDEYYWTTATRRGDAVVRYAGMPATYGVDFSVRF